MNDLAIPLIANKPQRRIPGTRCVAVTMHKSNDGARAGRSPRPSVASYAVFTVDGEAYLGTAHFHQKRAYRPRGYSLNSVHRINDECWSTLTECVLEMGKRLDVEVSA